ncbi:MAG TPA: hypothetical protein VJU61_03455 [Polyangiaceae bacterium]|nr:hypothetical protein [Polyangiaceae bacterium]
MLPAVVVDLGSQLGPSETTWVLDACNAAIVKGTCELDTTTTEAPRAVAIVRLRGSEGRGVHIEVGLREADRASWSVRELEFSPQDPSRERWRTVGLVLATLVGEIEAEEEERQIQEESAPAAAPAASAPGDDSGRENASPIVSSAPTVDSQQRANVSRTPVRRPGVFIGAGILGGPGAALEPLRWGAGARAGWISRSGWVLSAAADYSQVSFDAGEIEVGWWRLTAGPGYRTWLSERWSLELGLELGARHLRVAPSAAGSLQSSVWNPVGAAHVEVWWQALASAGAWTGVTMSSIGRETRLVDRGGEIDVVVPAAEFHALLGLWWAP